MGKEKRGLPLYLGARIRVVMEMSNSLMSDGICEFVLYYMATYLANKGFHVEMVKESGIYRLASDSHCIQPGKRTGLNLAHYRLWLLEAKEI